MGIKVNAIIINLNSGNYLQFDENGSSVLGEGFTSYDFDREEKIGVFSFNKQAFLHSPTNTKIQSPSDVAQFLSQQKFSSGEKAGYLLLTTKNEIVGNFFATQNTRNNAYKEVAGLVSKFGGVSVVAYTNKADINFYKGLKSDLNYLEINLHDVIECESSAFVSQTFAKYKSLAQEGYLYENPTNYQSNKSKKVEPQFELGFGHLGSGITVWNRLQMENNDYKTIAHISNNGNVDYYDKNLPQDIKKQIRDMALIEPIENIRLAINQFEETHHNSMEPGDEIYISYQPNVKEIREDQPNYQTNKSSLMETQNTLNVEQATSQGSELNNNNGTYRQTNLDYLNNQIKYLGFGEGYKEALKDLIETKSDKIDLHISKEYSDFPASSNELKPVNFTLHLNKGKESDMYFLNSYTALIISPNANPANNQSQTFYLNKGRGFTAKESFNLLLDRAVNKDITNKEGVTYNAWVKLKPSENNDQKGNRDFQIFNKNYGFDLKETLSKYPNKEMDTPEAADQLINSLKKGNVQAVTFYESSRDAMKFIEANPQYKNINVYNEEGKKQFIPHSKSETQNGAYQQPAGKPVIEEKKSAGMKR